MYGLETIDHIERNPMNHAEQNSKRLPKKQMWGFTSVVSFDFFGSIFYPYDSGAVYEEGDFSPVSTHISGLGPGHRLRAVAKERRLLLTDS
ncbi:MAG TPA: hypothetical protein VI958_08200, partial [Acidobacteriota bacterium]